MKRYSWQFLVWMTVFLLNQTVWSEVGKAHAARENRDAAFRVDRIARGLDVPWGMAFLSPDEIIFTQQGGKAGVVSLKTGRIRYFKDAIPDVKYGGQGGVLDVAVPRDYRPNGWIYFTYSKDVGGDKGATTLARARRHENRLRDWEDLLITRSATDEDYHYGSRIAFDGKGCLYFSIGDRGKRPTAQKLSTHAGSILRLNLDGSIPEDNPFFTAKNALPEIWSYGHRNPQGIVFNTADQKLWAIEHGPRGGDEINLILPGRNYGWPVISYGKEYWGPVQVGEGTHKEGMEQPVKVYTPSIAPGSLILYSGKAFPQWKGDLFAGALKMQHLNRIVLDQAGRAVKEERLLENLDERIRAVVEGPEGWIYFSTDSGKIFRIRPQ